ncbi:death-associated protein kinase 2 isoform X1 [Hydra vulgaris]|uniref:death-associated protein kinase 2 isoform X1 n=1 Tax=Hydra vulgaris TaxID=6087 RepID=UPI001F5F980E|nr:death-associated protein kinase 2 isoform X2 [Hydra vulgaris]
MEQNYKKNLEQFYEVKEELGRGHFAVVKKCVSKENNREVAAKFIKLKRSKASKIGMSKELIERESNILFAIDHAKIIKLYDIFDIGSEMVLVLELLTGGELFDKICESEYMKESDACSYMIQVLEAVQHIHSFNIVHLDIKPENIVLQSKNSSEIKLVDFGLAQRLVPGKDVREIMGTAEFVAPEIVNYEPIGCYTDMWAIGVLAYILVSGTSPFLGDTNEETLEAIGRVDYEFDDESFGHISNYALEFISNLLIKQPKKRLTAEGCLKHDWLIHMTPQDHSNSAVIATSKLKDYLAKRRWMKSFQKLSAIRKFSQITDVLSNQVDNTESIKIQSLQVEENSLQEEDNSQLSTPVEVL